MINSAEEFIRLLESSNPEEYRRASLEAASEEVWLELIERPQMAFWAAHSRVIPERIVRALAVHAEDRVRHRIAQKRSSPADILALLAFDAHESVRLAVATNPKTDVETLRTLLSDDWERVREVARERLMQRPSEDA